MNNANNRVEECGIDSKGSKWPIMLEKKVPFLIFLNFHENDIFLRIIVAVFVRK